MSHDIRENTATALDPVSAYWAESMQAGADLMTRLLRRKFVILASAALADKVIADQGQPKTVRECESAEIISLERTSSASSSNDLSPGIASGQHYLTIREAADSYFQGKISRRAVHNLFARGFLRGFRVGDKILLYRASLDDYCRLTENKLSSNRDQARLQTTEVEAVLRSGRPNRSTATQYNIFKPPPGFGQT